VDSQQILHTLEAERLTLQARQKKLIPWLILLPIALAVIASLLFNAPGWLFGGGLGIMYSLALKEFKIEQPFKKLKERVRSKLIGLFMSTYFPDVTFRYGFEGKLAKTHLKNTKLIRPDIYEEEDVLEGTYKNNPFYISEINLKNKGSKNKTHTIFKGILFRFTVSKKSFPLSRIQSKPNLLKKWFSDFIEDPEFGFWAESKDHGRFREDIRTLAPFIRHLAAQQGDVRIHLDGDQVTMMMESDMKFLDEPTPSVSQTFLNEKYFVSMGRQLHTLLFIIDAFVEDLQTNDIEERLELIAEEELKIPAQPIVLEKFIQN